MHFTTFTAAAILASIAVASPLKRQSASWTVQAFTRTCDDAANSCHYSYSINTHDGGPATGCEYDIFGGADTSARRQSYHLACGDFVIGSSWSGQFGEGKGFQVLSVVEDGLIIFPGYSDAELPDSVTVTPNKAYAPQSTAFARNLSVSK